MKPLQFCLACYLLIASAASYSRICSNDTYLVARDSWATLQVPPDGSLNLENNLRCAWHIVVSNPSKAVVVHLQSVELEGPDGICFDSLTISDTNGQRLGLYCGQRKDVLMRSSGMSLHLILRTDDSKTYGGFKLYYKQVSDLTRVETTTARPECQYAVRLEASTTPQYIRSPNYPESYPGYLYCQWMIRTELQDHVISVVVNDSQLDDSPACTSQSVRAYNGYDTASSDLITKWCGTQRPAFSSSGHTMSLAYYSSGEEQHRGFLLMYTAVHDSVKSRTTTIIVSIFASMAGIGVLLLIYLMWTRYRAKMEDPYNRPSPGARSSGPGTNGTSSVSATPSSRQLHLSTPPPLPPTPSSYSPPPYPEASAPPLDKDDPPPYWMAAAYIVDPSTLHGGRKQHGHVHANDTSGHAQDAESAQASSTHLDTRL